VYKFRNFNVQRSPVDHRDIKYKIQNIPLKLEMDLREWDSPVEDQGELGSCVSHALTSCYELMVKKGLPGKFNELSRLYSYYHTRVLEESVNEDAGVIYIRNAIKASATYGMCKEALWPYDIAKFKQQPSPNCYIDASNRKIAEYKSVSSNLEVLEALNQFKPIVIGLTIYDSFMTITDKKPEIPIPGEYDFVLGGHSVAVVGYSLPKKQFIIKNSFGTDWGDNGYCWMPFEYFEKYVFDMWTIEPVIDNNNILLT
jgi:C1A family cysteine protease